MILYGQLYPCGHMLILEELNDLEWYVRVVFCIGFSILYDWVSVLNTLGWGRHSIRKISNYPF